MQQQNYVKEGQDILAPTNEFPNRKFKLKNKVGQGAQGFVFLSICEFYGNLSSKEVVLKFSYKNQVHEQEIQFLKTLIGYQNSQNETQLPINMIKVYDMFEYQEYLVTVMEKGEADLYAYLIENRKTIALKEKHQICVDVVLAIFFLHQNGIIIKDIKLENYLKVENKFKFIDFGLVRVNNDLFRTKNFGTGLFQAPELRDNQQNYDDKVDVWALGCLFYEIFEDSTLFVGNTHEQIRNQIINIGVGNNVNVIINKINQLACDPWFKQLMIKMLQPDFKKRINTAEILINFQSNGIIDQNLVIPNQNSTSPLQKIQPQSIQSKPLVQQPQPVQIQWSNQQQFQQCSSNQQQQDVKQQQSTQSLQQEQQNIQQYLQQHVPIIYLNQFPQQQGIQQSFNNQYAELANQINNIQEKQIQTNENVIKLENKIFSNQEIIMSDFEVFIKNQEERQKENQEGNNSQFTILNESIQKSIEASKQQLKEEFDIHLKKQLLILETNFNEKMSKSAQLFSESHLKEFNLTKQLQAFKNKQFSDKTDQDNQIKKIQGETEKALSQIIQKTQKLEQQLNQNEQKFTLQIQLQGVQLSQYCINNINNLSQQLFQNLPQFQQNQVVSPSWINNHLQNNQKNGQEELKQMQNEIQQLQNELQVQKESLQVVQSSSNAFQVELNNRNDEIGNLSKKIEKEKEELVNQIYNVDTRQLQAFKDQIEQMKSIQQRLVYGDETLKQTTEKLQNKFQNELQQQQTEIKQAKQMIQENQKQFQEKSQNHLDQIYQLDQQNQQNLKLQQDEKNKYEIANKILLQQLENQKSKESIQKDAQFLKTQQENIQNQLSEANQNKEYLKKQLTEANQTIYNDQKEVQRLKAELDATKQQLAKANNQNGQLNQQLISVKQNNEENLLKTQLNQSKNNYKILSRLINCFKNNLTIKIKNLSIKMKITKKNYY